LVPQASPHRARSATLRDDAWRHGPWKHRSPSFSSTSTRSWPGRIATLYPERIPEHIPFSLTLLYPWLPAAEVSEADIGRLRTYFADCPILDFDLTRVSEFPGVVAYAVPEPDDELRAVMRGLWNLYPQCPPYGRPGSDPPPHATLTRYANPENASFDEAKERVEPLLPVHCRVTEATLQEEYEPDRMRIRATFPFGRGD
jgi:hypothetical protein